MGKARLWQVESNHLPQTGQMVRGRMPRPREPANGWLAIGTKSLPSPVAVATVPFQTFGPDDGTEVHQAIAVSAQAQTTLATAWV